MHRGDRVGSTSNDRQTARRYRHQTIVTNHLAVILPLAMKFVFWKTNSLMWMTRIQRRLAMLINIRWFLYAEAFRSYQKREFGEISVDGQKSIPIPTSGTPNWKHEQVFWFLRLNRFKGEFLIDFCRHVVSMNLMDHKGIFFMCYGKVKAFLLWNLHKRRDWQKIHLL